jgi:hypothetical protein
MNRPLAIAAAAVLTTALTGCIDESPSQGTQPTSDGASATQSVNDPGGWTDTRFEERLLEIARSYENYRRVDAECHWSWVACWARSPLGESPPVQAAFSESGDAAPHGQKLYSLFVKEWPDSYLTSDDYTLPAGRLNPVGQVVVKEAWFPEEVPDGGRPQERITRTIKRRVGDALVDCTDTFIPYAYKDGRLYHAARKTGLFIMCKEDPQTPGTDDGWVYGTVTVDGGRVTSSGRVASCMACHRDAPHDRLFGPHKKE